MVAREAGLSRRIRKAIEARGGYAVTIHGSPMSRVGCPDLLVCWRGRFVALEVKVPGNIPTKAQLRQMALIREAGGAAVTVHSVEEALSALA